MDSAARRGGPRAAPPPRHSAATSHEENDRYMDLMEEGFQALGIAGSQARKGPSAIAGPDKAPPRSVASSGSRIPSASASASQPAKTRTAAASSSSQIPSPGNVASKPTGVASSSSAARRPLREPSGGSGPPPGVSGRPLREPSGGRSSGPTASAIPAQSASSSRPLREPSGGSRSAGAGTSAGAAGPRIASSSATSMARGSVASTSMARGSAAAAGGGPSGRGLSVSGAGRGGPVMDGAMGGMDVGGGMGGGEGPFDSGKGVPIPFTPSEAWYSGPMDPAGTQSSLSSVPILCMSVHGEEAVVGSSDHALYTVDLSRPDKKGRTLYNKSMGHTEWVTCVCYLPDGRILSGGMDSKLCLWDKGVVRCTDLRGHSGSVSAVASGASGELAVSCSYDKTLRLWNVGRKPYRELSCLMGHSAPVLGMAWSQQGAIASGARDGTAIIWDVGSGSASRKLSGAHEGHLTSLCWLPALGGASSPLLLTGGQDACLRAWDMRSARVVCEAPQLHATPKGKGAIGDLCTVDASGNTLVVSTGADKAVKITDPRASFGVTYVSNHHPDFIYSLHAAGSLVFSGDGSGQLMVHDAARGEVLYGLGANKAAVRGICTAGDDRLVVSGDDGCVLIYRFK